MPLLCSTAALLDRLCRLLLARSTREPMAGGEPTLGERQLQKMAAVQRLKQLGCARRLLVRVGAWSSTMHANEVWGLGSGGFGGDPDKHE